MLRFRLFVLSALLLVSGTVHAALVYEKFAANPALDGWRSFGATNLFQWDASNHVLDVTWDSTQSNSYYYHPLDRTYTKADSFCVQFDLNLADDVAVGYFELAIGLGNFSQLTSTNFSRANAVSPTCLNSIISPAARQAMGRRSTPPWWMPMTFFISLTTLRNR